MPKRTNDKQVNVLLEILLLLLYTDTSEIWIDVILVVWNVIITPFMYKLQYYMSVGVSHDCLHLIGSDRILLIFDKPDV